MSLSKKEIEIMKVLWKTNAPMTNAEIIAASEDPSWKESSIYVIMNSLISKGAVVLCGLKPTSTNNARSYMPTLSAEDYTHNLIKNLDLGIDYDRLVKLVTKLKEG